MMKKPTRTRAGSGQKDSLQPAASPGKPHLFPVVGIGASAGGLEAFTSLLQHLPVDTGMAFVLVQHLDPNHESALVDLLSRATAMPVREAADHLAVRANHVYVIPPNASMTLQGGQLKLAPRRRNNGVSRCIDLFLESLAQDRRDLAIGVILSGTASDGHVGFESEFGKGSTFWVELPRADLNEPVPP